MAYYTDEELEIAFQKECEKESKEPKPASITMPILDLQFARSEMKRYRDALVSANNIIVCGETDPGAVEHQIRDHADTLPIVYRSVAGRVEAAKEVMQQILFEHFEGRQKNSP